MLGGESEGSREGKKSGERKVYSRKSFKSSSNSLQPKGQAIVSAGLGSDNFSDMSRDGGLIVKGGFLSQENKARIGLPMKSKRDVIELRRKLEVERDLVRSLMSRIDKVGMGNVEKEKRTLKANKLYGNSEFLKPNDKLHPVGSKKKSKKSRDNFPIQVFKSCNVLLEKLMKHKHGWVFNKPVDVVGLGLHDYFVIIREPMDLGTVKNRLNQSWYKSPMEFAEDVRLTFRNAMTYNPKEQDVYVMAEQLSKIFEDKWADMKKTIDIPEFIDPNRKTTDVAVAQYGKVPVPKKPKAKDPDKREMTYDEKHKLSVNLQDLPSEKLENVVRIIKKRSLSVSQQDDEIEVDIDSVDTETLWELDRFITNYKKSLSKSKRKAEDVNPQVVTGLEKKTDEKITPAIVTETPKESRNEERVASPPEEVAVPQPDDTKQGASKSSSGSDSGSSSSGNSDVESSSADGSNGNHSPNNFIEADIDGESHADNYGS